MALLTQVDFAFVAFVAEPDMPSFAYILLAVGASKSSILGFCFTVPTLNRF